MSTITPADQTQVDECARRPYFGQAVWVMGKYKGCILTFLGTMSIVTQSDQAVVDECAREYTRLVQERADRLEKLIMVAIMELSLGHVHRVQEVLNQAITS